VPYLHIFNLYDGIKNIVCIFKDSNKVHNESINTIEISLYYVNRITADGFALKSKKKRGWFSSFAYADYRQ
jgi:hypothetical protein